MATQTVWLTEQDIEALGLSNGRWHKLEVHSDGLVLLDNELWGFYDWRYQ